jgi:HAD superfamily hydrolase (TIGR01459 family)
VKHINSIKEISDYQYFIFDIWGVIHDGESVYPESIDAIKYLRSLNKNICFVSNAPRRNFVVANLLNKFGIDETLYDFIISSGEVAFINLKDNQENGFLEYGKNYFYIGPRKDIDLLQGLDYNIVKDAKDADFILTTGFDHDKSVDNEKLSQLKECLKYDLKMICVNPDLIVVKKDGRKMNCAGLIGKQYHELGGKVEYCGKPHKLVYKMTCNLFKTKEKRNIIAVGDSLDTDIIGANNNNIDSLLITGGLLSDVFQIKYWQNCNPRDIEQLCNEQNIFPNFVISNLKI